MNNNLVFLIIVIIVACTAGMSSDISVPSIPAMALDLTTSIDQIQASLAVFMSGLALSQLIYGPLSDVWGRKKPLMVGIVVFIFGNILAISATDVSTLYLARLTQGFGAGASASLWRSMFRDKYSGEDMAKYGGYLAIAMTFIVPAAPLIGGYLQEIFSWRASFIFMILYASLGGILALLYVRESHNKEDAHTFSIVTILKNKTTIVTNKVFLGYATCSLLCFGAFFSWFVIGPVLVIHQLGHDPSFFGWYTLIGGGSGIALSGFVNGRLVKSLGSNTMLKIGLSLMALSGSLLLLGYYIFGLNLLAIFIPVFLFYFGVSFTFPNSFAQAFVPFGHMAGTAAAVYGCMQTGGAVATSSIAAYIPDVNQVPLACIMILAPCIAWGLLKSLVPDTF